MLKLLGAFVIAIALYSCQKNDTTEQPLKNIALNNGLGDSPNKLNGYFFSSINKTISNNYTYYNQQHFAFFGDPSRNLMINFNRLTGNEQIFDMAARSNVSVGQVTIMNAAIGSKTATTYSSFTNIYQNLENSNFTIRTEGNGSFKPLNLTITRGFPKINQFIIGDTLSKGTDYQINKALFSNYDSVIVSINSPYSLYAKRFDANQEVFFSKEELSILNGSGYTLNFMLFNYSNTTVESKTYLFELSNRLTVPLTVTN